MATREELHEVLDWILDGKQFQWKDRDGYENKWEDFDSTDYYFQELENEKSSMFRLKPI
jgi:hypothetical protein